MIFVWIAVTLSSDTGAQYAPVVFPTEATCHAFVDQIPKGVGSTKCVKAEVKA